MFRIFSTLVLCITAAVVVPDAIPPKPCPCPVVNIAANVQSSVVFIKTFGLTDEGTIEPFSTGSGILSQGYGQVYVWTAAHVVAEAETDNGFLPVEVSFMTGETVSGEVLEVDYGEDIALLVIPNRTYPHTAVWTTNGISVGDAVWHAGCPLGEVGRNTVTSGVVSYVGRQFLDTTWDQVSSPVHGGSSGGGIFDAQGRCIGIVSRASQSGTFVLIVPSWRVQRFAQAHGILSSFPTR